MGKLLMAGRTDRENRIDPIEFLSAWALKMDEAVGKWTMYDDKVEAHEVANIMAKYYL